MDHVEFTFIGVQEGKLVFRNDCDDDMIRCPRIMWPLSARFVGKLIELGINIGHAAAVKGYGSTNG